MKTGSGCPPKLPAKMLTPAPPRRTIASRRPVTARKGLATCRAFTFGKVVLMPWFGVKCILRATHSNSQASDDLYDETVVVVTAPSGEAALEKATQIAEAENCQYKNVYGEIVTWEVERVLPPFELEADALTDGMEVYGRFYYLRDGKEVSPRDLPD